MSHTISKRLLNTLASPLLKPVELCVFTEVQDIRVDFFYLQSIHVNYFKAYYLLQITILNFQAVQYIPVFLPFFPQ